MPIHGISKFASSPGSEQRSTAAGWLVAADLERKVNKSALLVPLHLLRGLPRIPSHTAHTTSYPYLRFCTFYSLHHGRCQVQVRSHRGGLPLSLHRSRCLSHRQASIRRRPRRHRPGPRQRCPRVHLPIQHQFIRGLRLKEGESSVEPGDGGSGRLLPSVRLRRHGQRPGHDEREPRGRRAHPGHHRRLRRRERAHHQPAREHRGPPHRARHRAPRAHRHHHRRGPAARARVEHALEHDRDGRRDARDHRHRRAEPRAPRHHVGRPRERHEPALAPALDPRAALGRNGRLADGPAQLGQRGGRHPDGARAGAHEPRGLGVGRRALRRLGRTSTVQDRVWGQRDPESGLGPGVLDRAAWEDERHC